MLTSISCGDRDEGTAEGGMSTTDGSEGRDTDASAGESSISDTGASGADTSATSDDTTDADSDDRSTAGDECTSTEDCDDGIACTDDDCDWQDGCVNQPNHGLCGRNEVCDALVGCTPIGCTHDSECEAVDACFVGVCDLSAGTCILEPVDADGDGYGAIECGGTDCDDTDPNIYPGASETCNGIDQNCNGIIDDGFSFERLEPPGGSQIVLVGFRPQLHDLAWSEPSKVFGALWAPTQWDTRFQTLSEDGTPFGVAIAPSQRWTYGGDLIHDGTQFVMAVSVFELLQTRTQIALISDLGVVTLLGSPNAGGGHARMPSLAKRDSGLVLASVAGTDVRTMPLSSQLTAEADSKLIGLTHPHYDTGVAPGAGDKTAVTWIHNGQRKARVLDGNDPVGPEVVLGNNALKGGDNSQNANRQILWTGREWALTWQNRESGPGQYQIYLGRLDEDGTLISTHQLTEGLGSTELLPAIAWTGEFYLVVWMTELFVQMVKVSPAGDATPIWNVSIIGEAPGAVQDDSAPGIAWTGDALGVLWGTGNQTLHFVRVDPCG